MVAQQPHLLWRRDERAEETSEVSVYDVRVQLPRPTAPSGVDDDHVFASVVRPSLLRRWLCRWP